MKKQTAVEWLEERLIYMIPSSQKDDVKNLFKAAPQMEREQIIEAHENGVYDRNDYLECAVDY